MAGWPRPDSLTNFDAINRLGNSMKRTLILALFLMSVGNLEATTTTKLSTRTNEEDYRKTELQHRLCTDSELSCAYVTAIFNDPRLTIYHPPEPALAPPPPALKEHERNPYFTERFGLLTTESLERCKDFIQAHSSAFESALRIYGVPKEVICGHLRIETDFGVPTRLSPHPLGKIPAINWLVTLYVRNPSRTMPRRRFVQRQAFALIELKDLLNAASKFGWDLFEIPGSPTGAIGLPQFEPSSFKFAVDGDGDGKIDLFDPEDAILSVAHFLVTRGWDDQLQHQQRAIYSYYGGNFVKDKNKYYMKAVMRYADEIGNYLKDHPLETPSNPFPVSLIPQEKQTSRNQSIEQPPN
jgi:membrane-bound lytic murein transglycosylase B